MIFVVSLLSFPIHWYQSWSNGQTACHVNDVDFWHLSTLHVACMPQGFTDQMIDWLTVTQTTDASNNLREGMQSPSERVRRSVSCTRDSSWVHMGLEWVTMQAVLLMWVWVCSCSCWTHVGHRYLSKACPRWDSNSRPSDYETDALTYCATRARPFARDPLYPHTHIHIYNTTNIYTTNLQSTNLFTSTTTNQTTTTNYTITNKQ